MPITKVELDAIRDRLLAAKKSDDWGKDGIKLEATKEKVGSNAKIWYGDGDLCAEVHGNLGLGIDGDAVAEFFAHAMADVERLLSEIEAPNVILLPEEVPFTEEELDSLKRAKLGPDDSPK